MGLRLSALVAASVLVVAVPASGGVVARGSLGGDLGALLADPRLAGADVGLVVRNAETGAEVFDNRGGKRGQPASTAKLLTSAAALEVLGPDHRFATAVSASGTAVGGVLSGDLHLRGTGDPTVLAADYDALAASVARGGIRVVMGKLVADDTWFDRVRLGTGWAWDDEPYYYNAQISALTVSPDADYDAGSVVVRVAPGVAGAAAKVSVEPPSDYVQVESTAVTGPAGSASSVSVVRRHGSNVVDVSGSVPAGGAVVSEWSAVWEPTGLVTSLFRDALARNGVRVLGGTGQGVTPAGARKVAEHLSMPLSGLLTPFLKLSNNMHAEILVKSVGRAVFGEGSWGAGLRAVAERLGGLGVDAGALSLRDGSGLSRMDQVSAGALADLLVAVRGKAWFPVWRDALPVAGVADRLVGGTLRNRMRGTAAEGNARAKTGSLTGVSALAGYVTTASGTPLVFAMISNNALGSVRELEDAVVVRLASDREGRGGGVRVERAVEGRVDVECSWVKAC
ncbi:D-alanyl-D-alanine carboxypeptidase/D-alanyl-D-alanine-endopeptidase [Actinosynnema pretiosum]|uniref:D-alanyl-D-alanine carboxypeptidase/D-alanyl-D-alanine-endopeptidase n=1 Tax=Actinosynnema pretiosum TaxID=42197 RepID=A0A290ZGQ7_9PSEU|nr:D-alanyl-D-alanine carboxypeptidase/D-alanyl-D-alanine-endopeptidase [Actinosynnema pretiosum]